MIQVRNSDLCTQKKNFGEGIDEGKIKSYKKYLLNIPRFTFEVKREIKKTGGNWEAGVKENTKKLQRVVPG